MFDVVCKEDSAPCGFTHSVLVCIQVAFFFWISAEDKVACTCWACALKVGSREVTCSRFRP